MNAIRLATHLLVAALAASAGWFAAARLGHSHDHAATTGTERKIKFYQSPMHPWITSSDPGKCTICGMALAPVYEGEAGFSADARVVTLAPASASVAGVQTSEIRRAPLARTLRVTGALEPDETRRRELSAYTDARIEKLFVHTTGAEVAAGAPLAVVYSPELLTARQEFHALARTAPDSPLARAAREKLRRLGLLDTQLDTLAAAPEVARDTEILAPLSGTVVARSAAAYAGGYVKAGDALFTLGDLSRLWFVFDAYEPDLAFLRVGQPVEVRAPSLPGETLAARIDFIDPNLNPATRTARVRVELDNPAGRLLPGQTASGLVTVETPGLLLAPRSALLHTRREPLVYVELADHTYKPRVVRPGRVGDEFVEILSGLKAGEKVVTQGALLIDSQAQLAHPAGGAGAPAADTADTPPSADITPLPSEFTHALADASAALAADDLATYAKRLPALAAHADPLPPALAELAQKLVAGPDLASARAAFEPFSTAAADLVRAQPPEKRDGLKVFQCPMTPVLGTGRWLQRDDALRNPFFGSDMLECGEELP